jgi:predicted phage baseplate assembly protein
MSQPCGCCSGIQVLTPDSEANAPGLSAIQYRVGTYATFYETMLARLSTLSVKIPLMDGSGATQTIYPLQQLTTREPSDPSIALLDAWAVVGDVLTFYQERIANEGYLPTAIERRSMLELARLVNYTPRPGVSASVQLAFTMMTGFTGTIPAGTRAQSMPAGGQMPQYYETSADLDVSAAWNDLQPRLTRPQIITAADLSDAQPSSLHTLYLQDLTTNLKVGDGIILDAGSTQALRLVDSVTPQPTEQLTQVGVRVAGPVMAASPDAVAQHYLKQSESLFKNNSLAANVSGHLTNLVHQIHPPAAVIESLQHLQSMAAKRKQTRLGAWISHVVDDLNASVKVSAATKDSVQDPVTDSAKGLDNGSASASVKASPAAVAVTRKAPVEPPALALLGRIIDPLALAPSIPPRSSVQLSRAVNKVFAAQSDIAPQLLAAFNPAAATTLYKAWGSVTLPANPAIIYAPRVKASVFANNFAGVATVTQTEASRLQDSKTGPSTTTTTTFTLPVFGDAVRDLISAATSGTAQSLAALPLDATYDLIKPGSWVAIDRPTVNSDGIATGRKTTFHQVVSLQTASRETVALDPATGNAVPTGFTGKVTQLSLDPLWLSDSSSDEFAGALISTALLRTTVIYAQSEALPPADEPIDAEVQGSTVELDGLYSGLRSGRWVIVSGNRTDIPGATGVTGSELVMIAGVSQETASPGDTVHTVLTLANNGLAYTYDSSTVTIYGNVAVATNGQTVGEVLGNGDASQAFLTFALHQSPLTYLSAPTAAGAQSTLAVTVNDIDWQETDDLSALGPTDQEYITLTDNSAQTSVIFGNGENGARVPTGNANVKAVYRYGIGSGGNVAATQISQMATQPGGVQSVVNPLAASGGADADTANQARANTPLAVKALDRLVSVTDYADFSRSFAGIGKASSTKLSNGRRQVVFVTIAGTEDIPILATSDLYRNLVQALQQLGDPHLPIMVGVRNAKLLVIAAGIQVLPDYHFQDVEPNVRSALLSTFSFDQRSLGQTAFLSEAISAMQGVAGVAFVNITTFDSVADGITAAGLTSLSSTLVRRGHVAAKLAYVDSSPNAQGQSNPTAQAYFQIQPAEIAYLSPDIQDTLILTEITPTQPGPRPALPKHAKAKWIRR